MICGHYINKNAHKLKSTGKVMIQRSMTKTVTFSFLLALGFTRDNIVNPGNSRCDANS